MELLETQVMLCSTRVRICFGSCNFSARNVYFIECFDFWRKNMLSICCYKYHMHKTHELFQVI